MVSWTTADLCDQHRDALQVLAPRFRRFGGRERFEGTVRTVWAPADNSLVRAALEEPGEGAVLVVDGEGDPSCALLGDQLAALAVQNGWSGVLVHGCVRDVAELATMDLGVLALAAHPVRSIKQGRGERDRIVSFGGVAFRTGAHLYADADGIVVAAGPLPL